MRSQQKSRDKSPKVDSIPVLLVDDDVELCASLKRLLNMDGFDVRAVHDGDSGVRQNRERLGSVRIPQRGSTTLFDFYPLTVARKMARIWRY
jgi:PleD family two-component response regulator